MSGMTRDPNEKPGISKLMRKFATENNLVLVQFFCRESEQNTLNFVAYVDTVPRVGETVITENRKQCIVRKVAYNLYRENVDDQVLLCSQPIIELEPPND